MCAHVCVCVRAHAHVTPQSQDLNKSLEKRDEELRAVTAEAEQAQLEAEDWRSQTRKLNSQVRTRKLNSQVRIRKLNLQVRIRKLIPAKCRRHSFA